MGAAYDVREEVACGTRAVGDESEDLGDQALLHAGFLVRVRRWQCEGAGVHVPAGCRTWSAAAGRRC